MDTYWEVSFGFAGEDFAGAGVADRILLVSKHLSTKELGDNCPTLESLSLAALLKSAVLDIGEVSGVPAVVKSLSKSLEVVEDELELDVEGAVARCRRNGVLRGGLSNAL